jgi:hypothetical protein
VDDEILSGGVEEGLHLQVDPGILPGHRIEDPLESEIACRIVGEWRLERDPFQLQIEPGGEVDRMGIGVEVREIVRNVFESEILFGRKENRVWIGMGKRGTRSPDAGFSGEVLGRRGEGSGGGRGTLPADLSELLQDGIIGDECAGTEYSYTESDEEKPAPFSHDSHPLLLPESPA